MSRHEVTGPPGLDRHELVQLVAAILRKYEGQMEAEGLIGQFVLLQLAEPKPMCVVYSLGRLSDQIEACFHSMLRLLEAGYRESGGVPKPVKELMGDLGDLIEDLQRVAGEPAPAAALES